MIYETINVEDLNADEVKMLCVVLNMWGEDKPVATPETLRYLTKYAATAAINSMYMESLDATSREMAQSILTKVGVNSEGRE